MAKKKRRVKIEKKRVKSGRKKTALKKRTKAVRKKARKVKKTPRKKPRLKIKKAKKVKRSPKKAGVRKKKRTPPKKIKSSVSTSVSVPTLDLEEYEPEVKEEKAIVDMTRGSTRYAWIGAGQCGGRLVKAFYNLGYKKVLAINTTHHDLDLLELPANQKFLMDIGEKGAGKDMERGKEAVQRYEQEILHTARKLFGKDVDHIMVCFGAGGGTGSGSALQAVEIAKKYARYNLGITKPEKNVGVMMTLPSVGEASSPAVANNAYKIAMELGRLAVKNDLSPLVIVDNDKISRMYPGLTVKSFWYTINTTVAGLFDIFNRLSALSSRYTSFDPVDYHSIMRAGGCTIMGLTKVKEFKDSFAISKAVKDNLEKTLLAGGFDLSHAKVAGCIVVGGRRLFANVKGLQDNIDYAFDVLSEITGNATVHRGIYEDDKDSLRVYTIIGGLEIPKARLEELKK